MCGICGVWDLRRPLGDAHLRVGQAMGNAIAHRGPDGEGVLYEAGLLLVHRRLAVLDVSEAGKQPMISHCGRYVIVFNGEVYNHLDLRKDLQRTGGAPRWRGRSDTETILAVISAYGIGRALRDLVGMFAMAVWDRQEQKLMLARDRAGEKPLYYSLDNGHLVFGSDLNSFHADPAFKARLEPNAPKAFLRYGYIPAPFSIYENVHKIMPGTVVTITARAGDFIEASRTYWSLQSLIANGHWQATRPVNSAEEWLLELEGTLESSVVGQMISDVPLGAFLSGGIDSSLIVAIMQKHSSKAVNTFTVGFEDSAYDERLQAGAVARHLKTQHTEFVLRPQDMWSVLAEIPRMYSEPFADSSQIPTFLVSALARQSVTVALSGDAGDELFAGYNRYLGGYRTWRTLNRLPRRVRVLMSNAILAGSPEFWDSIFGSVAPLLPKRFKMRGPGDKIHKLGELLTLRDAEDYYHTVTSVCKFPGRLAKRAAELPSLLARREDWPRMESFPETMMAIDFLTYLPDDILVKVDRAAMYSSLETRSPFLDHRVVETAWQMPMELKIRNGTGKWPLRQLLSKHIPRSIIDQPKMGFGLPIGAWLRGPLRSWASDLLDPGSLKRDGVFDAEPINELWQAHLEGKRNWQHVLWNILMFQSWKQEHHPNGF